jgi:hypothetical protein
MNEDLGSGGLPLGEEKGKPLFVCVELKINGAID